ncbi:MAG: NAD(P)/FAD-dependent oxidoreductase [Methanomassiliicoccales archaeon]|nr:NAD(P)/FAD-dependent oxidoreductase [Methanomassiliicoccales archaeon]
MARKSMIVIGAGIAGLSTGCYARMNGYDVELFERHDKPGGSCTSWNRKGYTFDHCIHNLSGTAPDSAIRYIWDELGGLRGTESLAFGEIVQLEDQKGHRVDVVSDLDALEEGMSEAAPADKELVHEYVEATRRMQGFDVLTFIVGGGRFSMLKMLPKLGLVRRWGPVTAAQYSDRFQDDFLRRAFRHVQYGMPGTPMLVHIGMLANVSIGDAGWPLGGSMALSRNIERRFVELGGKASYGSGVEKVLTKDDKAVGVRLIDGTEHFADIVVSAADGHNTIYGMLDGKYTNETIRSYYHEWVTEEQDFGLEVFFGVARDLDSEPHAICILLDEPLVIEGREFEKLDLEVFASRMGVAPKGKAVIKATFASSYDYWKAMKEKGAEAYDAKKTSVAEAVLAELEKRFPGLRAQVEAKDVVTPITSERYLGAYRGLQAWPARIDMKQLLKEGVSPTLPGLRDFYMVGQYAQGMIGLITVAAGGRKIVRRICKEDKRRFQTTKAQ